MLTPRYLDLLRVVHVPGQNVDLAKGLVEHSGQDTFDPRAAAKEARRGSDRPIVLLRLHLHAAEIGATENLLGPT